MLNLDQALNILGLQRTDPIQDIRCKYLKLAKINHPDKFKLNSNILDISTDTAHNNTNFIAIKEAYEYIIEYKKSQQLFNTLEDNSLFNGFVELVDSSDIEYDEQLSSYIYICRCGEIIQIQKIESNDELYSFICQTCSLKVKITFT